MRLILKPRPERRVPGARRFEVPMQNIYRWWYKSKAAKDSTYGGAASEEMIPVTEVRSIAQGYEKQIKLKNLLANMTVDRDILKPRSTSPEKKVDLAKELIVLC